ncbi:MAG: hypothetical protein HYZ28_21820 [Myxococcales bacterium]|nr:hypothetical protein [Myxococcales bacterium]
MRGVSLTLAALLALGPAASFALGKEVQKYLRAAATLYENLEYEKALQQIERAKAKSEGAEDDAAISFYEGVVLADLGKEEEALTAFKLGLSMDPEASLPLEVSPKVEATFEKARQHVKKLLGSQLEKERPPAPVLAPAPAPSREPPPAAIAAKAQPREGPRRHAWIPAAGGALLAGAGAVFLFQAKGNYDSLLGGTVTAEGAAKARDEGRMQQTLGLSLCGAGVAALAAAGGLLAFGGGGASATALVGPEQAYLGIAGSFP